jgi:S-DNA-T family DNA segregation ATPase FtsK/SpoIIIE
LKRQARIADLVLLGLFSIYLFAIQWSVDPPAPPSLGEALRWGGDAAVGPAGLLAGRLGLWLLGPWLRWLLPFAPLAILAWLQRAPKRRGRGVVWIYAGGVFLSVCGLASHEVWARLSVPARSGGALGAAIENLLATLIGPLGSFLLLSSVSSYLLLRLLPPLHFDLPAWDASVDWLRGAGERLRILASAAAGVARGGGRLREVVARAVARLRPRGGDGRPEPAPVVVEAVHKPTRIWTAARVEVGEADESDEADEHERYEAADDAAVDGAGSFQLSRDPSELLLSQNAARKSRRRPRGALPLPSLDLLDDVTKENRGFSADVLQMKARLLLETLANYGIEGRINEIRPGPVVTTFEFEPAAGVKVSSITSRQDDLALAMKAIRIRIEAPIPGKAAVGIEIPNPFPQMVTLKEVISTMDEEGASPLSIVLGKDTEGMPHVTDIREMPHLLVAGATGSGKSVCINAIICNLLLRNGPDALRMLMIDPKMLELSVYNGIPHLLHPVITEPREALKAVKWAVAEMSVRYHKLAKHGVRNIIDYNARVKEGRVKDEAGEKVLEGMPYFVLIVDELADLMMQLGQDLETPIARLAQMARAVGIHLVLATQRPSVNVITGVIKANFPSRIAFRVMSKVDSRTILDSMGADSLLGKGDMLFLLAGSPQPVRVHGAFITIEECERIVAHWQQYTEEDAELEFDAAMGSGGIDLGEDDLLFEAKKLVVLSQSGSTSMLQRRLRVGYTRAARLMDMLEAGGIVGPFEGSKAREVLVAREEFEAEA